MIFRPDLATKVMAGEKTQTRRLISDNPRSPWSKKKCLYQPDGVYAVQPGRGKVSIGKIRILETRMTFVGRIAHAEARAEGFESVPAFVAAWEEINGSYDPNAIIWALTFEVAS